MSDLVLAYARCQTNVTPTENYLQLEQDDPVRPGGLGLGQARAVLVLYVWFAYSYSTPLLGGLLADCWLGRRKTIQIGFM